MILTLTPHEVRTIVKVLTLADHSGLAEKILEESELPREDS